MKLSSPKFSLNIIKGWIVQKKEFTPDNVINGGSIFMTGNGYLGYRGTFPDWDKNHYTASIVSDTYDNADNTWKELCNVPNGLFTRFFFNQKEVSLFSDFSAPNSKVHIDSFTHGLDTRTATTNGSYRWNGLCTIEFSRFAHIQNIHTIPQQIYFTALAAGALRIKTGIDGEVWSLHGDHFKSINPQAKDNALITRCITTECGLEIAVAQHLTIKGKTARQETITTTNTSIFKDLTFHMEKGDTIVLEQFMTVFSAHDTSQPYYNAQKEGSQAIETGYNKLAESNLTAWNKLWDLYDIVITAKTDENKTKKEVQSQDDQFLVRYNTYHNIIATPAHTDHLPIGARGLSCQAYQGAAFWDQEIFNLPMYIHTNPSIARNLLMYRYKTLQGARNKAEKLGCQGAFYAWVSGDSGEELCPDYFFKEVITGRKIRNHFNDWQIHISPDIGYALLHYYRITDDWDFISTYGAEVLFAIARFLFSRAVFRKDKNRYEIQRVLGPDEYHENIDNNTFTNIQAKFVLQGALDLLDEMKEKKPHFLATLQQRLNISEQEPKWWQEMVDLLHIPSPDPDTKLIEQFEGYFSLEDTTPEELKKRLLDPQEYWGAPIGVAHDTQIIKQADILQLFALHPDLYSQDIMTANYNYYEPRTHHRSSLSPAVHALIAARLGRLREGYKYFKTAATIDLYDTHNPVSGGTFIGGIHTAACGIIWQVAVFGFAGYSFTNTGISFCPRLPDLWQEIRFSLIYQGQKLHVGITHREIHIRADHSNQKPVPITSVPILLPPGEQTTVSI